MALPYYIDWSTVTFNQVTREFSDAFLETEGGCFATVANGGSSSYNSIEIVAGHDGVSNNCMRFIVDGDDSNGDAGSLCSGHYYDENKFRAEIAARPAVLNSLTETYWYGHSVFVPTGTPTASGAVIMIQTVYSNGGPDYVIQLVDGDEFVIKNSYYSGGTNEINVTIGTLHHTPNSWHHFVIEHKRAYTVGGGGVFNVWMAVGSGAYSLVAQTTSGATALDPSRFNNQYTGIHKHGCYWGTVDRPGTLYRFDFSGGGIATGTGSLNSGAFNLVDPRQEPVVTVTPPSVPAGYTKFPTLTTTWTAAAEDWAVDGTEYWTRGELMDTPSNAVTTAVHSGYTATGAGTLDIMLYGGSKPGRTSAAPYTISRSVSGSPTTGTYPQNTGVYEYYALASIAVVENDAVTVSISNEGLTANVAADEAVYKFTAAPVLTDDIALVGASSITTATGEGTTISVAKPADAAYDADVPKYVLIHIGVNQDVLVTPGTGLTEVCARCEHTGDDCTQTLFYRLIDGTEGASFTATLPGTYKWSADCCVLKNVSVNDPFTVRDTTHTATTDGTYHLKHNDNNVMTVPALVTSSQGGENQAVFQFSMYKCALGEVSTSVATNKATSTEVMQNNAQMSMLGTFELVATAGDTYTAGTHTHSGMATTTQDGAVLTFAMKRATTATQNPITFPQDWETPIAGVAKNSGTFVIDPTADAPITCTTGTLSVTAFAQTGCQVTYANNLVSVTPRSSFSGTASLLIIASNGLGDSSDQVQYFTVTNTGPVASDFTVNVGAANGNLFDMAGKATDVNNDPITYTILQGTSQAPTGAVTASITSGILTINALGAAAATYTGITYTATDDSSAADTGAITVVVTTPATTPTTTDFAVTVLENSFDNYIDVLSHATDSLPLTIATIEGGAVVVGTPIATTHGYVLVLEDAETSYQYAEYTPTVGYDGSDSFTYTVTNGTNASTPADTCTITVTASTAADSIESTSTTFSDTIRLSSDGSARSIDLVDECGIYALRGGTITYAVTTTPSGCTVTVDSDGVVLFSMPYDTRAAKVAVVTASIGVDDSQAFTITLTPTRDAPTGWRVMSYNIERYYEMGGYTTPDNVTLAGVVSDYSPDILCLQEVPEQTLTDYNSAYTPQTLLAELVTMLGFDGYVYGPTTYGWFNNAILYKGTLLSSSNHEMVAVNGTGDARSFCIAKVQNANGDTATFVNTHLATGSQAVGSTAQGAQARTDEVAEIYAVTSLIDGPVILCGDWNHTVPGVLSYDLAENYWDNCSGLVTPTGAAYSASGGQDTRDWIYIQQDANWYSVVTAFHIVDDGYVHSDHNPVYADICPVTVASTHGEGSGNVIQRVMRRGLFR